VIRTIEMRLISKTILLLITGKTGYIVHIYIAWAIGLATNIRVSNTAVL
jgi:hypothetical protein